MLHPALPLALDSPADTVSRLLCMPPWPARHRIDVSDPQVVRSQAVCPIRPDAVRSLAPKPVPDTVTLADPDPPVLARPATLTSPAFADRASLMLPARPPTDTASLLLPSHICAVRQLTDVEDAHDVCCDGLPPIPDLALAI